MAWQPPDSGEPVLTYIARMMQSLSPAVAVWTELHLLLVLHEKDPLENCSTSPVCVRVC
jgi:hypothetical protein